MKMRGLLVMLIAGYLYRTKTGKAMRAVSSDSELAKLSGIKSDRIILMAFAIFPQRLRRCTCMTYENCWVWIMTFERLLHLYLNDLMEYYFNV